MVGDVFASTTGTLFLDRDKTSVHFDVEYGLNRDQLNSLTLTFDKSLVVEEDGARNTGYLLLEVWCYGFITMS